MMKERLKKGCVGGLIHFSSFLIIELLINGSRQFPPQAHPIEYLPWLVVLYIGYALKIGFEALGPLAAYCFLFFVFDSYMNWNIVYHDMPPVFSPYFILAFLFSYLFLVSPIFVNLFVRWLKKRYKKL